MNKRSIIIIILLLLGFGIAAVLGAFDSENPEPAASASTPTAPAKKSAMEQAKEDAEKAAQSAAAAAEAEAARTADAVKQAAADAVAEEAAKQAVAAKAALNEAASAAEKAAAKAAEAEAARTADAVKQVAADAEAAAAKLAADAKAAASAAEKAAAQATEDAKAAASAVGDAASKAAAKRTIQPDNPAPAPQLKNDKYAPFDSEGDGKGVGQQAMSAAASVTASQPLQRGLQDGKDAPSRRSVQLPADMQTAPASTDGSPTKKPEASFDVVQIERDGSAVFAGKAEPGARVVLRSGDNQIVGVGTAGLDGSWVILSENPLSNGEATVRLESTNGNGVTTAASETLIISKKPGAAPLVVAQSDAVQTPTVILQQPEPATNKLLVNADTRSGDAEKAASERIRTQDGALTVGTVDYDKAGRLTVQGKAPPGANVSVDVDGEAVGSAKADAAGNWTLNTASGAATGGARIGATANLTEGGKLAAGRIASSAPSAPLLRVSLPFAPMGLIKEFPLGRLVVVQPGNSLWRIARRIYGDGVRYSIIYAANAGQIRNPDLIYPGQIFHTPQSRSVWQD